MPDPKSISTHYEIGFHCFTLRNTKCIKNLSIYSFKRSLDRCYNLAQRLTQKKVLQSCQSTRSVRFANSKNTHVSSNPYKHWSGLEILWIPPISVMNLLCYNYMKLFIFAFIFIDQRCFEKVMWVFKFFFSHRRDDVHTIQDSVY